MKITVREKIGQYELPESVDEFIQGLEQRIAATGQPRESISIKISTELEYDVEYGCIELSYVREETPEEKIVRYNREKQCEMYEKQKLAYLKAKYE